MVRGAVVSTCFSGVSLVWDFVPATEDGERPRAVSDANCVDGMFGPVAPDKLLLLLDLKLTSKEPLGLGIIGDPLFKLAEPIEGLARVNFSMIFCASATWY